MEHIILYALVPIIVIMFLGYVSGKIGAFNASNAKTLNKLVLNYALPAALFISIVKADRAMLIADLKLTIISVVVLTTCFLLVYGVFYKFYHTTKAEAAVSALISGSPTIGFLGFAVLQPIYGNSASVGLVIAIVAIVVNAIGIPLGLSLLNSGLAKQSSETPAPKVSRHSEFDSVIDALSQPVAWAPILAVIIVALGFKWPEYLDPSFNLIAQANASVAVFAAGITLSTVKVTLNLQAFMGSFMKLIFMPLLLLAIGLAFHLHPMNLRMLVICGALPPAFSGIIIASRYNTYVATGTSSLALSTILFIITLPLWIWVTEYALKIYY